MPGRSPAFSIILAAGKGTRMRSASLHKVCFPIDGKPAIHRAIETYNACGIRRHVVVVGAMAGQVMETVGRAFDNAVFAYQPQQLGTAHAARMGLQAVTPSGGDPAVLLVAGDRIIERTVLEQFFDVFYTEGCELALLACPRPERSSQGRLVTDGSGNLLAVIEMADIRQRRVYAGLRALAAAGSLPGRDELVERIRQGFAGGGPVPADEKLAKAFGKLWSALSGNQCTPSHDETLEWAPEALTRFEFTDSQGHRLIRTPEETDASELVNNSVYLIRASCLEYALGKLDRNNAQQEEYLSGIVAVLAHAKRAGKPRFTVRAVRVDTPQAVMGYNDPAELLEVEEHIKSRQRDQVEELPAGRWYRSIAEWQELFRAVADGGTGSAELLNDLVATYGEEPDVLQERARAFLSTLDCAAGVLGPNQRVLLVRSPGRVNVLSRHIDHQGGNCNLMTMGYETLMAVHARDDDAVRLFHVDHERFRQREFSIGQLVSDLPWDDWLSLVNSEKVSSMVKTYGGDWSQYVMAAVLRLQKKFADRKLRGMDMIVSGNVPMAAGLSSSSSLVVGAADATIAVNRLGTFPAQFVDLCGEGEWFVGTRGGSADHAAVKLGQKSRVIKVRFFDFAIEETVPFPEDHVMVVCDSGVKAQKSASAKNQFNHRIACYRIGFQLIRKTFPQYAPLLHHLRDVNVRNLGIPLSWVYRLLLHLPDRATREELGEMLPAEVLAPFFATHDCPDDGLYPIRGVVLFGLAECERARLYADTLKAKRLDEIGRMMDVSHDGDRVARFSNDWQETPFRAPTSNQYLLGLMEAVESGDPGRVMQAQLQWQAGSYHCSIATIDRMADIATRTPGVLGAQLAGAGLGGCMMVLAHRDAVDELVLNLEQQYYDRAGIPSSVLVCRPIAGSGLVMERG